MSAFDLFLSHNGVDKVWTERLAVAIEADRSGAPLKVFFDKWDILPGSDVPVELEAGLQNSRYIGLVLTPEALSSDWISLERSTAIHRDPRARQRTLIPLLRRDCQIPDMLARLNRIDFRLEQNFNDGVSSLVNVLRGRPAARGDAVDSSDFHFREDASLLRSHRSVFDRGAFKTPCIWELFITQLNNALDDTLAAVNTGSLYSRGGNLLSSFPNRNQYILPDFKQTFSLIVDKISEIKRELMEFEFFFRRVNPGYSHHQNFYAMLMDSETMKSKEAIIGVIGYMDAIDQMRNDILTKLNVMLVKCGEEPFSLMELSSKVLKAQKIGGANLIAQLLESP